MVEAHRNWPPELSVLRGFEGNCAQPGGGVSEERGEMLAGQRGFSKPRCDRKRLQNKGQLHRAITGLDSSSDMVVGVVWGRRG
jgi:hypothetical protein